MNRTIRHTGKVRSFPAGMAISAAVSMIITLTLSAVIAWELDAERISWDQAGYWIMGMLFASSFAGALTGAAAMGRQHIVVSLLSGLLYWSLLLCVTALFFGGDYEAIWVTGGMILAGCGTSALIARPKSQKRSVKKGRMNR